MLCLHLSLVVRGPQARVKGPFQLHRGKVRDTQGTEEKGRVAFLRR